jgi:TPR repeat protein
MCFRRSCGLRTDQEGVLAARYSLGIMYLQGDGVLRNLTAAVEHLQLAADGGIAEAYSPLGAIYLDGYEGTPRNLSHAKELFAKGKDLGDGEGMCRIRV